MPSNYTTRNRAEKQAAGENANTWGTRANENTFDMFDEALDGYESIAVAGNVTLTSNNGASDQARKRYLKFTGTGGFTITIPNVQKVYHVFNSTNGTLTFSTGGGTTASVPTGKTAIIVCEGGNVVRNLSIIADGASQWAQIATSTPAGVNSVTFSSIASTYKDLLLVFDGIDSAAGSDTYMLQLSADGTNFSPTLALTAALGDLYGAVFIPGSNNSVGMLLAITDASGAGFGAAPDTDPGTSTTWIWRVAGIQAIRLSTSSASNFNAGTVTLYGRS
jgi:hypothetical protein